jgi:hypothetical protein
MFENTRQMAVESTRSLALPAQQVQGHSRRASRSTSTLAQPSTHSTAQVNENLRQHLQNRPQQIMSPSELYAIGVGAEEATGNPYSRGPQNHGTEMHRYVSDSIC